MDKRLQAGTGAGVLHEFFDQLDTGEHHALTRSGDMWEKSVFDGIVFGTVRRVVSTPDFNPNLVGERLQILLENRVAGPVASSAVTEEGAVGLGRHKKCPLVLSIECPM